MIIIYSVNYDTHAFKCHNLVQDPEKEISVLNETAKQFISYEQGEKNIIIVNDINNTEHIDEGYFIHNVENNKIDIYHKKKTPIAGWTGINYEYTIKKILYFATYELDTEPITRCINDHTPVKPIEIIKNKNYDALLSELKETFKKKKNIKSE